MSDAPPPLFSTTSRLRLPSFLLLAVSLFFGAGGVWLLSVASRLYSARTDLRAHAEHATGTVVDFKQTRYEDIKHNRHGIDYTPVFTFTDRGGVARRITSGLSNRDQPDCRVGDTKPIVYHRDRPDEAEFDTFFALWGGTLIAGGIGTAFLIAASVIAGAGVRQLRWPGAADAAKPRDPAILEGP